MSCKEQASSQRHWTLDCGQLQLAVDDTGRKGLGTVCKKEGRLMIRCQLRKYVCFWQARPLLRELAHPGQLLAASKSFALETRQMMGHAAVRAGCVSSLEDSANHCLGLVGRTRRYFCWHQLINSLSQGLKDTSQSSGYLLEIIICPTSLACISGLSQCFLRDELDYLLIGIPRRPSHRFTLQHNTTHLPISLGSRA